MADDVTTPEGEDQQPDERMPDIPICDSETFIVYSKYKRPDPMAAPTLPNGEPTIFQSAAFHCVTGFKAAGSTYDVKTLHIKPEISDDGELSFKVTGDEQGKTAHGSFNLTLTTRGNDVLKSCTKSYHINVLVLGRADICGLSRHHYYVGDPVDGVSVKPGAINDYDYVTIENPEMKDNDGYWSGLSLYPVKNTDNTIDDVRITGTATRPGIYLGWVKCSPMWSEGGQYDKIEDKGSFQPGCAAWAVIVEIIDDDHADGLLMVKDNLKEEVTPDRTIFRCYHTDSKIAEDYPESSKYLKNMDLKDKGDGECYSGSHVEEGTTQAGDPYTITWEYQLRREGGHWILEGRKVDSRDDKEVDWDEYGRAKEVIADQQYPNVRGWNNHIVIQAPSEFLVQRYIEATPLAPAKWESLGFFHCLKGDPDDPESESVYEQQVLWTPQFTALIMPAEYRFDDGLQLEYTPPDPDDPERPVWTLKNSNDKVRITKIKATVTPYAPPQTEYYDNDIVREPAMAIQGKYPHGLQAEVEDGNPVVKAGNRWKYWPGMRRMTPRNGTGAAEKQTVHFTASGSEGSEEELKSEWGGSVVWGLAGVYADNGGSSAEIESGRETTRTVDDHYELSADVDLDGQGRTAAEVTSFWGCADSGSGTKDNSTITESWIRYNKFNAKIRDWEIEEWEHKKKNNPNFDEDKNPKPEEIKAGDMKAHSIHEYHEESKGGGDTHAFVAAHFASGPATSATSHNAAMSVQGYFKAQRGQQVRERDFFETDRDGVVQDEEETNDAGFFGVDRTVYGLNLKVFSDEEEPRVRYRYHAGSHNINGTTRWEIYHAGEGDGDIVYTPDNWGDPDWNPPHGAWHPTFSVRPQWAEKGFEWELVGPDENGVYGYTALKPGKKPEYEQGSWTFSITHWYIDEDGRRSGHTSWTKTDSDGKEDSGESDDPDGSAFADAKRRLIDGGDMPDPSQYYYETHGVTTDYTDQYSENTFEMS